MMVLAGPDLVLVDRICIIIFTLPRQPLVLPAFGVAGGRFTWRTRLTLITGALPTTQPTNQARA